MKRLWIYLLVGTVILSCKNNNKENTLDVRPVKTTVAGSRVEVRKEFLGMVEPIDFVRLAFRVSGQIISLPVVEGQRVKKGDLIAAIDTREISLQYSSDKSAYETAASQLERNKRLLERQAISQQEFEISNSDYQQTKSAYEHSVNNMKDTKLLAPFEGSIEERFVENYQRVNSGEGVVRLINTDKMHIRFTIPDAYLPLLKSKDQRYKVIFDTYKDKTFNAEIKEYLDISSGSTGIPVSIVIDDPTFDREIYAVKPGFTCQVIMVSNVEPLLEDDWIDIPLTAVMGGSSNEETYIWVVENQKVTRRKIAIETPTGEARVLVTNGLKEGEVIVIAGVHQLVDGQKVKVLN